MKKILIASVSIAVIVVIIIVTIIVLVTKSNKSSSPTFLTIPPRPKAYFYGCPAQTFELKMNPSPHWVGDGSDKRILNVDGENLVCARTQKTVKGGGWFSHFKRDNADICYHVKKDIRDKDNNWDWSKCVAGPKF